ncbi:MAG: DUF86 domain-containing protein [Kiritimatiellaeota bacterium]|nr:DUF86 domain-containing protein [Kiritimatiellota bacterium]
MRREKLYLADMLEAADAIGRFLGGVERDRFLGDDLLRSAVLQKLSIIGEAAARLPKDFHARHPVVEWRDIVGFRNIAVHAYFAVQWSMVWTTATRDVPELRAKIAQIMQVEFPEDTPPHTLF